MHFALRGAFFLAGRFFFVSCNVFFLSPSFSGAGSLPAFSSVCLLTLQGLPHPLSRCLQDRV